MPGKKQSSKEDLPLMRVMRQREAVEELKHDNEVLRLDLTREKREAEKSTSKGGSADVARLQDQAAMYVRKIDSEKKKIEDLDKAIAQYQARILDQKTRSGGVNAAQTNNQLVLRQIKVLEGRVDKTLLKFNEVLAQNKVYRQRLDEYRRERVVFDAIYKKLERELHEKKKEMAAIIEDSKNAYQSRDRAMSEMKALQEHAEKEKSDFETDFKELGDMIKQQQAALEQLRLKQFERTQDVQTVKTVGTNEIGERDTSSPLTWAGNKDKIAPLSQETIHSYEDALAKIQESAGTTDINEIVTRFLEAEEQNFSLFNYVNDVNTEIERLEHSIGEMRTQIEKYRGQGMSTDNQRKRTLRDLQDKLDRALKKTEDYNIRYDRAVKTISTLKDGIHSIFTRIGAASTSVEEMLGQGVTESNMIQYLGIIEQRTSEILQSYAASQIGQNSSEYGLQWPTVVQAAEGNASSPTKTATPFNEDASLATGGEDGDSEEDERPLTRQELDKKIFRESNRRKGFGTQGQMSPALGNTGNLSAPSSPTPGPRSRGVSVGNQDLLKEVKD